MRPPGPGFGRRPRAARPAPHTPGPKRRGAGGALPGPVARRRMPQGEGGAASPPVEDRDETALDGAFARGPPGRAGAARSPRVDRAGGQRPVCRGSASYEIRGRGVSRTGDSEALPRAGSSVGARERGNRRGVRLHRQLAIRARVPGGRACRACRGAGRRARICLPPNPRREGGSAGCPRRAMNPILRLPRRWPRRSGRRRQRARPRRC